MASFHRKLIIPLIIDGKEDVGSELFDVVSPKTGKVCWRAVSSSSEDATRAVEAAQRSFPSWSKTKPQQKQKIFFKAANILESRIPEYNGIMETEMGGAAGPVRPMSCNFEHS